MAEEMELEKLEWIPLETKLNCMQCTHRFCTYTGFYNGKRPKILIDCPKHAKPIKIILNYISAIPILFLFRNMFHLTSGKFFLSLLFSICSLFFYDIIFLLIEELIKKLYEKAECNRLEEFEVQKKHQEQLLAQKEEEERIKEEEEKREFQNIELANEIYQKLKALKNTKPIQSLAIYPNMLKALKDICEDLQPEHFRNYEIMRLFNVDLPELITICQEFIVQYNEKVLSAKDIKLFKEVLKTIIERFENIKKIIWQPKKADLSTSLELLKKEMEKANKYDENANALSESIFNYEDNSKKEKKS